MKVCHLYFYKALKVKELRDFTLPTIEETPVENTETSEK